jgi:type IV secretion system protein VirB10
MRYDRSPASVAESLEATTLAAAPSVARAGGGDRLAFIVGTAGIAALGLFVFSQMDSARRAEAAPASNLAVQSPVPPAPVAAPTITAVAPQQALPPVAAPALPPQPVTQVPVLVIDSLTTTPETTLPTRATAPAGARPPSGSGAGLTPDELFAGRVGADVPDASHAQRLANPASTVAEGTIIPAVLETAVNSDLSGYVRALVSRDVRSFDGSAVLIPRGARLTGQYRSGLSTGQKRVYITWTRLLRSDGVTIQLASPGIDALGQSGTGGKVDSHNGARYVPTVLLSVLSGALNALANTTSIVLNSGQSAQDAATQALANGAKIPPTIHVPQGEPIQVFVTRDLDFTTI